MRKHHRVGTRKREHMTRGENELPKANKGRGKRTKRRSRYGKPQMGKKPPTKLVNRRRTQRRTYEKAQKGQAQVTKSPMWPTRGAEHENRRKGEQKCS